MGRKSLADRLVAHRGYMQRYPENTLPALQAALDAGAAYVEFDLQMNKDHQFIILHDDNFERTTAIAQSVFDTTTAECLAMSAHHPELFADQFNPTPVSRLSDFMALLKAYPATTAMVEIKSESLEHWGLDFVMRRLLKQLQPYHSQCVLISFSADAIEYSIKNSTLRTGWVFEHYDEAHRARAKQLGADFVITDYELLPKGEAPWPEFERWMLWDIISPARALEYSQMGVELIETADILGMRNALKS